MTVSRLTQGNKATLMPCTVLQNFISEPGNDTVDSIQADATSWAGRRGSTTATNVSLEEIVGCRATLEARLAFVGLVWIKRSRIWHLTLVSTLKHTKGGIVTATA